MLESSMSTPLHFTVEFFGFLVTVGGALLVASRPSLIPGSATNRMTASVGFLALAAAQVLHGGAFIDADGDGTLLAAKAFGLALLLIAVSGGMRSGAALAGISLKEPLVLVSAGAAALLALLSLMHASRSKDRAMRTLAVAALLLGAAEVLTGASPQIALGTGESDGYALAAHATKLVAYFALGVWLWSGVRSSIRTRFVAAFGVLLVAVVLVLSTALTAVITNNVEEAELERVRSQIVNALQDFEDEELSDLKNNVEQIAEVDPLKEALAGNDRDRLDDLAGGLVTAEGRRLFELDFVVFMSERSKVLAWAATRQKIEGGRRRGLGKIDVIKLSATSIVQEGLESRAGAATAFRFGDVLALLSAARVDDPTTVTGRAAGVALVGRYVDLLDVESISGTFDPSRATVIVGNKVIGSALDGRVTVKELLPSGAESELDGGEIVRRKQVINGESFFSSIAKFKNQNGIPIDAYLVLSSPGEVIVDTREGVVRTLFLVAMGIGAIALALAWLSGRRITGPIQALTAAAQRVREGDLDARAQVAGEDEVGQLGETFNEMTASLVRMTSDLREAAREEHRLRARIETIIQSMADGLIAVDPERRVLAFNREAEVLTGIRAKKAMGQPIEKVLDPRDSQGQSVTLPIHELSEGSVGNIFLMRRGGEPVPIAVTSAVLRGEDGEPTGGVAVIRDVSREHELERMKGEFLANISHELRTPLTPIKGYAEILGRKDIPPEKSRQFVTGILESTERLERIVGLLVDFSAMEAGRLSPRAAPVDIGSMVEDAAKEWAARSPRHQVVAEINARLPKVLGDERLLGRALSEVLDNAVKFSPQGGTIRLQAKQSMSGNGQGRRRTVQVVVEDQGIGIPPEDLPKIFYDFHQLDGSETRTFGGLGLGLAFVQRIVEAHEGSVAVESAPEAGTRLIISIPAARRR
jgi:two-component system sensor histidine kinase VicK